METQNLQVLQPSVSVELQRAETESQIDIAKRYPRDLQAIKKKVLQYATCDEETAKSCFYSKPVDNQGAMATGPSIRLAEIVAASFTNIRYGSRVIEIADRWVKVQGTAIDMENNIAYTVEVQRSIYSEKNNYRYNASLIETTTKAAAAIAVRDAIYKVVPMAIFNAELKKIKETATGKGSGVPLSERITRAFAYFKKLGVEEKKVLDRLDVTGKDEMTEDHLEVLVGLKTALDDKELTIDEAFTHWRKEAQEQKQESVKKSVKGMMPKKEEPKKEEKDDPSRIPPEDLAEATKH